MEDSLDQVRETRPAEDEHAPYYGKYIALVPAGDIVRRLDEQIVETLGFLESLPPERGGHRYAPGKWSIREVVGHLCDAERVFAYRAMRFARADSTDLPGFDENAFVANARFDARDVASLADEFEAVRWGTVALFDALQADEWNRRGTANNTPVSVRALAWIIAGHERHHLEILRTRYQ